MIELEIVYRDGSRRWFQVTGECRYIGPRNTVAAFETTTGEKYEIPTEQIEEIITRKQYRRSFKHGG